MKNKLEKAKQLISIVENRVDSILKQNDTFDLKVELRRLFEDYLNDIDENVNYKIIKTPEQLLEFFSSNELVLNELNKKLNSIFREILIDSTIENLFKGEKDYEDDEELE